MPPFAQHCVGLSGDTGTEPKNDAESASTACAANCGQVVVISSLSVQMRRRQGAYLYMDGTASESLDTKFFVVCTPSQQRLHFVTLNSETGFFLSLRSRDPLNWPKTLTNVCEVMTVQLVPLYGMVCSWSQLVLHSTCWLVLDFGGCNWVVSNGSSSQYTPTCHLAMLDTCLNHTNQTNSARFSIWTKMKAYQRYCPTIWWAGWE
jgi:hypothetical protein